MNTDARIPVRVLRHAPAPGEAPGGAGTALLILGPAGGLGPDAATPMAAFTPGASRHRFGCACCGGRSAAAEALDRLFQARVRGACAWFDRVLAILPSAEARAELAAALREDRVTAARFRAGG